MKFAWLLLIIALPAIAAPLPVAVDSAMRDEMRQQQLVGLAVGVIRNGRVAFTRGYGWADREKKVPVTQATLFRWASISKSLTAVTALQLWERNRLNLEADVRLYVPEFPAKPEPISAQHLLCNQGGIVHYSNGPIVVTLRRYEHPNPFKNVVRALDTFKHSPVINPPGEKYGYTTHGFILLSAAVERAGQQPFADQVRDRIAKPLGMKSLQPDYQWLKIPHRAVGYRKRDDKIVPSTNTDVSWKLGGGGFISNIDDLARFANGLLNHRLIKPATRARMWTPQKTNHGQTTHYGLGFSFKQFHKGNVSNWKADNPGTRLVGHSGSQEKTRTYMLLWPKKKIGVVLMTNSEHANISKLTGRLLATVVSATPEFP